MLMTAKVVKGGLTGPLPQTPGYQWYKDNQLIAAATTSTYSLTAVKQIDSGTYSCLVTNQTSTVGSNACVLTVNLDVVAPKVTLLRPVDKSFLTNGQLVTVDLLGQKLVPTNIAPLIMVNGKVTDAGLITSVIISNSADGSTTPATIQKYPADPADPLFGKPVSFLGNMTLVDGTNVFSAIAKDYGTNEATSLHSLNVYYMSRPQPLHVTTNGHGSYVGKWTYFGKPGGKVTDGALLNVGETYTITAIKKLMPGNAVLGWSDGTTMLTSSAIYTFTMSSNLTLQAEFAN